jgi:squalene synthase HpnC
MTASDNLASGKGKDDENFPVASVLIAPERRRVVLAFYRVARMADDIADHATAPGEEKLARLAEIERTLLGTTADVPAAAELRDALGERGVPVQHMLELLEAFRRDVTKARYANWAELMDYCRYSAAPVGRFMLDVHGEDRTLWPASDALCAALQVINHLQDCAKDFKAINRVYIPLDQLAAAGLDVDALGAPAAAPALRGVIARLAGDCQELLDRSRRLAGLTRDARLALEIGVIHRLARDLARRLQTRDPLSQRVHHRRPEALALAALGAAGAVAARFGGSASLPKGAIQSP